MLENKNIIYFSCLNWNDNWQRQQEFAVHLAKRNKLLFISPIGSFNYTLPGLIKRIVTTLKIRRGKQQEIHNEVPENIFKTNFFFIPWHNNRFFEFLNRKILLRQLYRELRKHGMDNSYILWTGNPSKTISQLVDYIKPEAFIYDNAMRFEKLAGASDFILDHERIAVQKSTFSITDNDFKKKQYEEWGGVAYKIPQAVDPRIFDRAKQYEVPESLKGISHPIAGYYGAMHSVLDYELLEAVAKKLSNVQFVLIGALHDPSLLDRFKPYSNVHYVPPVPHSKLPSHLAHFDVCLIPYVVNDYTKGTFPNKLFEYFSFLKPVVAEPLPEFDQYKEFMYLASDASEFAGAIEVALRDGQKNQAALEQLVLTNDWNARFEAIEAAFQKANV